MDYYTKIEVDNKAMLVDLTVHVMTVFYWSVVSHIIQHCTTSHNIRKENVSKSDHKKRKCQLNGL